MCILTMFYLTICSIQNITDNTSFIVSKITQLSIIKGVDPDLALAVAKVESGMKWNAVGINGEVGPLQVKRYKYASIYDVDGNIRAGLDYILRAKNKCGAYYPGISWINCYNLGINYRRLKHPESFSYHKKVSRALGEIKIKKYLVSSEFGWGAL